MIQYRVRTAYRIAAWFPGLAFLAMGLASLVTGVRGMANYPLNAIAMVLIGVVLSAVAFFFIRIGWTGRGPAFIEEYGLDGPVEIELFRAEARRQGRLYE